VSTQVKTIPILLVDLINQKTAASLYQAALAQLVLLIVSFAAILGLRFLVERRRRHG
jgi:ABC-type Fe3+ transport system permease subunit